MEKLTLPQKIFIVKKYYKNNEDLSAVTSEFEDVFMFNPVLCPETPVFASVIDAFESSGSVTLDIFYNKILVTTEIIKNIVESTQSEEDRPNERDKSPEESSNDRIPEHSYEIIQTSSSDYPIAATANENEAIGDTIPRKIKRNRKRKTVELKTEVEVYENIAAAEKLFECSQCEYTCKIQGNLKLHQLVHVPVEERESFECDICGKVYHRKGALRKHQRQHTGDIKEETPRTCPICSKVFSRKQYYDAHLKTVHSEARPYVCSTCNRAFKLPGNLKTHQETHVPVEERERRECEVCHKVCYGKMPYLKHKMTHTGKRDHICEWCGKTYLKRFDLSEHIRIHTGDRPTFECHLCDKSFVSKTGRKAHLMNTHHGQRPHKCSVCEKAFSQGYKLKVHMRTHTGETPYKCELCGKACKQKDHLRSHIKNIHARDFKEIMVYK